MSMIANAKRWLVVALLFTIHCSLFISSIRAQIGSWQAYMSYQEPQQIVKAGQNDLFVRASNGLYQYNLTDHSITTFDKVRQLNDTYVSLIAWNQQVKRLIVVYQNSNIDLIDLNQNVTNISALYSKSMMQDKTVNAIFNQDQYVYLATGFGVIKINMQRAEVAETYILNHNTTHIGIANNNIYIRTLDKYTVAANVENSDIAPGQVTNTSYTYDNKGNPLTKTVTIQANYTASLSQNLIDPHSWTYTDNVPTDIFTEDRTDWNQYIETIQTLQPGGPKYNYFGFMKFKNNKLYSSSKLVSNTIPFCLQVLNNEDWHIYQDEGVKEQTGYAHGNVFCFDIDPSDPEHVFAGARNGLFEYRNGKFVNFFNSTNSPFEGYNGKSTNNQLITGLTYDNEGNLWILNSQAPTASLIKYSNGTFTKFNHSELMKLEENGFTNKANHDLQNMIVDSEGLIWFVNNDWRLPAFYRYNPQNNTLKAYETFVNQDGTSVFIGAGVRCIAEDINHDIWIGTNVGPLLLERSRMDDDNPILTQVKVPRNDGTSYADYLLSGVDISSIVVDAGNRKWFGSEGNGIYLISADNMEELAHYTVENSPLISNIIESMTIDNSTGKLFIGTDAGLCSYMTDATSSSIEMTKDNVYAYPNPVQPGYDGLITILGLSFDADVKILTTNGQLVAEGRSNGGTFTWNGRDSHGRRVASGVYMVVAATSEGKKGTVCKIAVVN